MALLIEMHPKKHSRVLQFQGSTRIKLWNLTFKDNPLKSSMAVLFLQQYAVPQTHQILALWLVLALLQRKLANWALRFVCSFLHIVVLIVLQTATLLSFCLLYLFSPGTVYISSPKQWWLVGVVVSDAPVVQGGRGLLGWLQAVPSYNWN